MINLLSVNSKGDICDKGMISFMKKRIINKIAADALANAESCMDYNNKLKCILSALEQAVKDLKQQRDMWRENYERVMQERIAAQQPRGEKWTVESVRDFVYRDTGADLRDDTATSIADAHNATLK